MEKVDNGTGETRVTLIHSWDPEHRRILCGAPGQIGSTKHARDVTCATCLELLGRPPRDASSAATQ